MYEGFSNNCEPNKCEHLMTKFPVGVGLHQGFVAWAFSFFHFVYEPLFFRFVYGQHYVRQPDEIPWYMLEGSSHFQQQKGFVIGVLVII